MSKLAKGLLGAFVLVACGVGADDGPSSRGAGEVGEVSGAVAASGVRGSAAELPAARLATALPSEVDALVARTCPVSLSRTEELLLFGRAGAPRGYRDPRRILPDGDTREVRRGERGLVPVFAPGEDSKGARAAYPASAAEALSLEDEGSGLSATVTLVGATAAAPAFSRGLLVYPRALGAASVVVRPAPEGPEDYVLFPAKPAEEAVRYTVTLGSKVASVHTVAATVELVDALGVPRLRMGSPELFDGACRRIVPKVTVTGCAVDANPVRTVQRAPTAAPVSPSAKGAARVCTVTVDWSGAGASYPATLDPVWSSSVNMVKRRGAHTATKTSAAGSPSSSSPGARTEAIRRRSRRMTKPPAPGLALRLWEWSAGATRPRAWPTGG